MEALRQQLEAAQAKITALEDIIARAFWLVLASVWCQKGLGPVTRTVG